MLRQLNFCTLTCVSAMLLAALLVMQLALPRTALAAAAETNASLVRFLVRDQLTTLNDACQSKNFSVLRAKASPNFQRKYSEQTLNRMFPHCGPRAIDLRRFLSREITLSKFDVDNAKGFLGAKGHIEESGLRLGFELHFEDVTGEWKLSVIDLELTGDSDDRQPAT